MQPTSIPPTFHLGDALRCALLHTPRGPNLARPRSNPTGAGLPRPGGALWKNALLQRPERVALARWDGPRLLGLAAARTRSGVSAWEIDGLYLPCRNRPAAANAPDGGLNPGLRHAAAADAGLELLEELVVAAGLRSAQRIFLRLPADSPALGLARRSGFAPCYRETLWDGHGRPAPIAAAPNSLRPRLPEDDYPLFQLFCASVPLAVRQALGPTFQLWQDSRASSPGPWPGREPAEWVVETGGRVVAWLGMTARQGMTEVEIMANPDWPDLPAQVMDFALSGAGPRRWLTPEYQAPVGERLLRLGFRPTADLIVLVKMVAIPALGCRMAAAEA